MNTIGRRIAAGFAVPFVLIAIVVTIAIVNAFASVERTHVVSSRIDLSNAAHDLLTQLVEEDASALDPIAGIARSQSAAAERISSASEQMRRQVGEIDARTGELGSRAARLDAAMAAFSSEGGPVRLAAPV